MPSLLWLLAASLTWAAGDFREFYEKGERASDPAERIGYYTEAIQRWTSTKGSTQLAYCHYQRGRLRFRAGEGSSAAIPDLTRALELDPNLAEAFLERGLAFKADNKPSKAASDLSEYLDRKPDQAQARFERGHAYFQMALYEKARQDFLRAAELKSQWAAPHLWLGRTYAKTDRCREALDHYGKARALGGGETSAETHYYRGVCLGAVGQAEEGISELTSAAQAHEDRLTDLERSARKAGELSVQRTILAKSYFERGKLHEGRGSKEHAWEDFEEACALEFGPACPKADALLPKVREAKPKKEPKSKRRRRIPRSGDQPRVYGY